MLDYGALPPEINSARMYCGSGPASILAAAAAWESLAEELSAAGSSYGSIVSDLASGPWTGPSSSSMAAAAAPFVSWLTATGEQARQTAAQATAAAAAYESAFAATVPPPLIEANRSVLATLVATNFLGQNTPAIAATEAQYAEMWAQDAAAMYGYSGASAAASQLTSFTTPPKTTNPSGTVDQSAAGANSVGSSTATDLDSIMSSQPQLISATPQDLTGLGSPQGLDGVTGTTTGSSSSTTSATSLLIEMSTPLRMASMPMSMLSRLFTAGSTATAAKAATTAASELGAVHAVGITSGAGALGSPGFGGIGSGSGALTASMGRATAVGPLSVPHTWAAETPVTTPAAMATHWGGSAAVPAGSSVTPPATPPMMPVTNVGGRPTVPTPARFELRSRVVPFTPAAG